MCRIHIEGGDIHIRSELSLVFIVFICSAGTISENSDISTRRNRKVRDCQETQRKRKATKQKQKAAKQHHNPDHDTFVGRYEENTSMDAESADSCSDDSDENFLNFDDIHYPRFLMMRSYPGDDFKKLDLFSIEKGLVPTPMEGEG